MTQSIPFSPLTIKQRKLNFVYTFQYTAIQWHLFCLILNLLDLVEFRKLDYLGGSLIRDFRTVDGLSLGSSDKDIKCHHLTFYCSSSPLYYFSAPNTTPCTLNQTDKFCSKSNQISKSSIVVLFWEFCALKKLKCILKLVYHTQHVVDNF